MNYGKIALLYLLTIPVFFIIDMIWLGLVARNLYRKTLAGFLSDKINWPAAIIFYLIFIIGILIFAVFPALGKHTISSALLLGGLFGFFTYATYDLTNLATMKNWPLSIVLVDIIWGILLSGSVAAISYLIGKWIGLAKST
jgi:uncharacterized membrane protein